MGYTIENKKIVIWTVKVSEAWDYPFNDEFTNYTYFYKNLRDKKHFAETLAVVGEEAKIQFVAKELNLEVGTFILKSKKSHNKKRAKANNGNK